MPLATNKPMVPAILATGANIKKLTIDLDSQRILVEVEYGELTGSNFKRRTDFPNKMYTIEGVDFTGVAGKIPTPNKSLYDVIKDTVWEILIAKGWESGSII